jgi:hypothetical protein
MEGEILGDIDGEMDGDMDGDVEDTSSIIKTPLPSSRRYPSVELDSSKYLDAIF